MKKPPAKKPARKPVVAKKRVAKPARKPATSGDDRWWTLIERSGKGAEDGDEHAGRLLESLKQLELEEIVAFDRFVLEKIRDAVSVGPLGRRVHHERRLLG